MERLHLTFKKLKILRKMSTLRDKVPNLKAPTQPQLIFFSALIKHNRISNNTQAKGKASLKECSIS